MQELGSGELRLCIIPAVDPEEIEGVVDRLGTLFTKSGIELTVAYVGELANAVKLTSLLVAGSAVVSSRARLVRTDPAFNLTIPWESGESSRDIGSQVNLTYRERFIKAYNTDTDFRKIVFPEVTAAVKAIRQKIFAYFSEGTVLLVLPPGMADAVIGYFLGAEYFNVLETKNIPLESWLAAELIISFSDGGAGWVSEVICH